MTETIPQRDAVNRLVMRGWRVDHTDDTTVYLSKRRPRMRAQTWYAQVRPDGVIEGHESATTTQE